MSICCLNQVRSVENLQAPATVQLFFLQWLFLNEDLILTASHDKPPNPSPHTQREGLPCKTFNWRSQKQTAAFILEQKTSSDPDVTKEDSVPQFLTQGRPEGQPTQLEPSEGAIVRNVKGGKQAQTEAMRRKFKCFLGGMNNIWKKGGT